MYQDFKQVVFNRKDDFKTPKPLQVSHEYAQQRRLDEDDLPVTNGVSVGIKKQLMEGRRIKHLTQAQLAQMIGIRLSDYNRIENGQMPLNGKTKSSVQNALGIKIK